MYFHVILLFCLFNVFHTAFTHIEYAVEGLLLFETLEEQITFLIRYGAGAVRMIDDVADPDAVAWNAVGSRCGLYLSFSTLLT